MNQIWLAFITGLTTGGLSCFAVQGGLLASSLAQHPKENHAKAVGVFLAGKIASNTILGIMLGLIGSSIIISPKTQGWMQIGAGVFMLLTVGRLLDLHPIFKKFVVSPPKSVFRLLRTKSQTTNDYLSAGFLGFLTVLIPCGITQSMMLVSVATGNLLLGGAIMFAFILGTTPVFFALGITSAQAFKHKSLKYVAALAILVLGLVSINTGQILRGSIHTLQNYYKVISDSSSKNLENKLAANIDNNGAQVVNIEVLNSGYSSDVKTIKLGVPVKMNLTTNNVFGCSRAFTIPEYNISKILPATGTELVEFTPTRKGQLTYTCSMGMYTGYLNVI